MPGILSPALEARRPSTWDLPPRARLALGVLISFALTKLVLQFVTTWVTPYGIHRDEFLYLSMGKHLHFWRMDFPPMIAVLAQCSRFVFGDTLFAVRFFPALAGTAILALTGLMTRELGGGRLAQVVAMSTLLLCALFLRASALFQPVVFDQLCWTLGFFALLKLSQQPRKRWWMLLGFAGALGLLTKFSIGFFAVGILVGLLVTQNGRSLLKTRWPYVTGILSLLFGSASVIGQIRLGFPVLLQMHDLQASQLDRLNYLDFILGQILMLGPAALLAGLGAASLLFSRTMRPYRIVGWTCLVAFLVLMVLHGKAYYIGPIYPLLFAAGAAALDRFSRTNRRVAVTTQLVLVGLWGVLSIPFGLPLLPPQPMAKFATKVGISAAVKTNQGKVLSLPQDYADMLGWEEQVEAVAQVFKTLTPEKQAVAVLIARNYGEAGALEFYGAKHGLPSRVLLGNNDLLWPPPPKPVDIAVSLGVPTKDLARFFRSVNVVSVYDNTWRVPEERNVPICIVETLYRDIYEAWPTYKRNGLAPPPSTSN